MITAQENSSRKGFRLFPFLFLLGIVFLLGLILYVYDIFFLDNELQILLSSVPNLEIVDDDYSKLTGEFNIIYFDEGACKFNYCLLNDCTYDLTLGCDKFIGSYKEPGKYIISFEFDTHKFSITGKRYLRNWGIELISTNQKIGKDSVLMGLKNLLRDQYIWEVFSIPIAAKREQESSKYWLKNTEVTLSNDYLKSIYLLNEVLQRLGDNQLHKSFEKEIDFLNLNKEEIIERNSRYILYPEAYILKLVELGLDKDYLFLLDEFDIPDYDIISFSPDLRGDPLLMEEKGAYSKGYSDLARYADYYRIFKEHERDDLVRYSYNRMLEVYNSSGFSVYGLCSIGYSEEEILDYKKLNEKLEEIFSNNKRELIETNVYELFMCDAYSKKRGVEIKGLEGVTSEALQLQVMEVNDSPFIARGLVGNKELSLVGPPTIMVFNLVDNLMYLLYEE